jgi:hypothetical protein
MKLTERKKRENERADWLRSCGMWMRMRGFERDFPFVIYQNVENHPSREIF